MYVTLWLGLLLAEVQQNLIVKLFYVQNSPFISSAKFYRNKLQLHRFLILVISL